MVVNFNYRLLPPFKFLMESYRFIGKLDGHIFYKNMILILFTGLVGLIRMPMGWVGIKVIVKRIP